MKNGQLIFVALTLSLLCIIIFSLGSAAAAAENDGKSKKETVRKEKLFPVFQIVKFSNTVCTGITSSTRNGTCYTAAECTSKGGTSSGSCASGYGVCCVFTLSCGGTSSQNCSYLVQTTTTKAPTTGTCAFTLCKSNSNICRIRLDFTTFVIAAPVTGSTGETTTTVSTQNGGGIGDCATDSFSFSSPGNVGSPLICGYNTGQHMIVDASDSCNVANFDIGASSDTRQWDIKVTQYACGDDRGGPEGCLQYFTGSSGRVSSFNFPTTATTIGATTTHLSSQCYSICFRQEANKCSICYTTYITNTFAEADVETAQTSFGLSLSATIATTVTTLSNNLCISDYLGIPNAQPQPASAAATGVERICGRIFTANTASPAASISGSSVCSFTRPFRITFKTDGNEATTGTGIAAITANADEQSLAPGGIIGFSLNFVQQTC